MPDRDGIPRLDAFLRCFLDLYGDDFTDDQKRLFDRITGKSKRPKQAGVAPAAADFEDRSLAEISLPEETRKNLPCKKVFVSYATEDRQVAFRVHKDLTAFGVKAWLDREDLLGCHKWKHEIARVIRLRFR